MNATKMECKKCKESFGYCYGRFDEVKGWFCKQCYETKDNSK